MRPQRDRQAISSARSLLVHFISFFTGNFLQQRLPEFLLPVQSAGELYGLRTRE